MMWNFNSGKQLLTDTTTGETRRLNKTESELLSLLLKNRHRTVSREEILNLVWQNKVVSDASITRSVALLRQALNDNAEDQRFIRTLPREGYRVAADQFILAGEPLPVTETTKINKRPPLRLLPLCVLLAVANCALFWVLFVPPKLSPPANLSSFRIGTNLFSLENNDPVGQLLAEALIHSPLPRLVDFYISSNQTRIYVACVIHQAKSDQLRARNFSFDISHPVKEMSQHVVSHCH